MKKINHIVMILASVIEVFQWIGAGFLTAMVIMTATGHTEMLSYVSSLNGREPFLAVGGLTVSLVGLNAAQTRTAYLLLFLAGAVTCVLMALVFRNIHLIFKTTEGKTKFSEGPTPFQNANVRMVREIGIFCIAAPVIQAILGVIARTMIGPELAEVSNTFSGIVLGLVVLCLSQFFAYGVKLQKDTEGLV